MIIAEKVRVEDVVVPKERLRETDKAKVEETAASIEEQGQLSPIIVRRITDSRKYRLIAGAHRLEAHKLLGWPEIVATVRVSDDSPLAAIQDEIDEIDENIVRNEMQPGEKKLATRRRKELCIERRKAQKAEEARQAMIAAIDIEDAGERRKAKDKARKAIERGRKTNSSSVLLRTANDGEFTSETAKAHGVTERAVQKRVSEADDIVRLAEWAKVKPRALALSTIQASDELKAATTILDTYGKGLAVEAGNVLHLLKVNVRAAAKGDDVSIVNFKRSVDAELSADRKREDRAKFEAERFRHLATLLSKAAKAVLDAEDVARSYKESKTAERLNRMKTDLRAMAEQMRSASK